MENIINHINTVTTNVLNELVPQVFGPWAVGFDANNTMHLAGLFGLYVGVFIWAAIMWKIAQRVINGILTVGTRHIAKQSSLTLTQSADRLYALNVSVGAILNVFAVLGIAAALFAILHNPIVDFSFFC